MSGMTLSCKKCNEGNQPRPGVQGWPLGGERVRKCLSEGGISLLCNIPSKM